ncbi:MAG: YraN family protein [Eubacterium sp.]|nr:YraN family protein [Eubacterium sp.]
MGESTRALGAAKERLAEKYLTAVGYRIIERNYRCRSGEIDLIGLEKRILAFIEVKYRSSIRYGDPTCAVNHKKRRTICRVASYFRLTHPALASYQCRFDIVSITPQEIALYRNAFEIC